MTTLADKTRSQPGRAVALCLTSIGSLLILGSLVVPWARWWVPSDSVNVPPTRISYHLSTVVSMLGTPSHFQWRERLLATLAVASVLALFAAATKAPRANHAAPWLLVGVGLFGLVDASAIRNSVAWAVWAMPPEGGFGHIVEGAWFAIVGSALILSIGLYLLVARRDNGRANLRVLAAGIVVAGIAFAVLAPPAQCHCDFYPCHPRGPCPNYLIFWRVVIVLATIALSSAMFRLSGRGSPPGEGSALDLFE